MTINHTKARVQEALKNIEDTPLGKAFTYWITQELHRSMDDILAFQISMDGTPDIAMSVTFLPETHTTTMQHNQVLAFGIPFLVDDEEEEEEASNGRQEDPQQTTPRSTNTRTEAAN